MSPQAASPTPTAAARVAVPADAGNAQIDACMAEARGDGPGTWVVFPAGKFAYAGTLVVPDHINLTGQGIWDQGAADGAGGTWLQCPIEWGSYSTIARLLLGVNDPGKACIFTPCPQGDAACGAYTQEHGSTGCTFSQARFKGGSTIGDDVFSLTGNHVSGWSTATNPPRKYFLLDTIFTDCEFERPQAPNSHGVSASFPGGAPGMCVDLWYDCRAGGAQIAGDRWIRCHFGVKNGYHNGPDGYGIGTTFLVQSSPSSPTQSNAADRGPNMAGGSEVFSTNWNPDFNWSQVDHAATGNTFTDCLFEYSTWYPMDICDNSRQYSMWHGVKAYLVAHPGGTCMDGNAADGYGNPPGARWTTFPHGVFIENWDMTRCYLKGSTPGSWPIIGEEVARSTFTDCYCGTGNGVFNNAGICGNVVTGRFPGGHPTSPLFTVDWSGTTTSYTPSPYDP